MKTRAKIKSTATELFNQKGVRNVTLREVAKTLDKSYGNVTYHFKTKNHLLLELFDEMVAETSEIMQAINPQHLFQGILDAPKTTFKISMKYLFFYVDYVEIRRSYPDIYQKAEVGNAFRKQGYLKILEALQTQKILRKELTSDDLNYLMDLSGAMRTFFFLNLSPDNFKDHDLEKRYVDYVNNLVKPYLTARGLRVFNQST